MKLKVNLREWFYNAGIIGFIRIIGDKVHINKSDNVLEFDSEVLKDFHNYYFNFFLKTYSISDKMKSRMDNTLKRINGSPDNIKQEIKYIKSTIKLQIDKIKKFNIEVANQIIELYEKLDLIKGKEDLAKLEEIFNNSFTLFNLEEINNKLTMNFFKSVLSNNYFGQPSFLNVVKSSYSLEEQKNIMYKDYISSSVETAYLNDIVDGKYLIQEISNDINNKINDTKISDKFIKIYNNIQKKYISKNRDIDEIKKYIKEEVFTYCSLCENEHILANNYTESNFIPLAVSSGNMKNFFWNMNDNFPVCDFCKLILFCIPAGITRISKIVKDNDIYKEKEIYSFVNLDTSIERLEKTNNAFKDSSKKENSNPYQEIILDIIKQNTKISEWELNNIFFVEFEAEYLGFSRVYYFNISKNMAKFFIKYAENTIGKIADYRFKIQLVDYILKNNDISIIINERLRNGIKNNKNYGIQCYLATKARYYINFLKKEENKMEEKSKNDKRLDALYAIGNEVREKLKRDNVNKIETYSYKLTNAVRSGNKKDFMDTVIKLHLSIEKDVSQIFLDIMKDGGLDFYDVGHSYISGLVSDKYENNKGEVINNEG